MSDACTLELSCGRFLESRGGEGGKFGIPGIDRKASFAPLSCFLILRQHVLNIATRACEHSVKYKCVCVCVYRYVYVYMFVCVCVCIRVSVRGHTNVFLLPIQSYSLVRVELWLVSTSRGGEEGRGGRAALRLCTRSVSLSRVTVSTIISPLEGENARFINL